MKSPVDFNASVGARLRREPGFVVGAALLLCVVGAALFAPTLDSHDALDKNVMNGLSPLGAPLSPSAEFPLGTDMLGRCQVARLLLGARVSLAIAAPAAFFAVVIGVVVGAVAGYAGGLVDGALMRLVDFVLAFPFLLIVLAVTVALRASGAETAPLLIVLSLSGWVGAARVLRARVLRLRGLDFMVAARALGAGHARILWVHVLPNLARPIAVLATLVLGEMLLAESALSFLGMGVPPPTPSWGHMLREGQTYLQGAPWLVMAPGAAILGMVLACNLLGEALRDALDPGDRRLPKQVVRAA